jgi:nucleoside-diphosphate-sugar epimerase
LKIINVVLEHIYGPNDGEFKFIEGLIRNIAILKVPRVPLTHGHQKRDFVYLDDVVSAYLKLVEYGRCHDFGFKTYEVGTGASMQVRDVAEIIKQLSNSPTEIGYGDIPYRKDEIMTSTADISALAELGWAPKIGIYEGLSKSLRSYGVAVNGSHN